MPYIDFNVSNTLTSQKENLIKSGLGKIIEEIPGKTESRLMIQFKDNCRLWFGGENSEPMAFINVMVYGSALKDSYQAFSDKAIQLISAELEIPGNNIYVKFEEVPNWFWG